MTKLTEQLDPTLDKVEDRLPPIPRSMLRFNRTVTRMMAGAFDSAVEAVTGSGKRVAKTGSTGVKTVTGQAKAQASRTADIAEEEALDLIDSAEAAISDEPSGSYESWTKDELYDRAQELDIEGRSSMSKSELIAALRR